MSYELIRYQPMYPAEVDPRPNRRWIVYYRVPGELSSRVVFVDTWQLTDDVANRAIEEDMTAHGLT